ncbi:serine protease FAM111A-like [Astyanax mexicanus]|uniref:serine protease FAM111A-like n=1 Tax=Astyanax mexicanus TaxID=7994 RepID=UPI0020CB6721|nr:serine protease FAM111A-like [Astyanax mexicanus]
MLSVKAYRDDTIEQALKRDGRFADIVFQSGCTLQHCDEKHEIKISENVRALEGHFYKICLPRKNSSKMPDFEEIYKILRSQFPEFLQECLKLRKEDFEQRTGSFTTMYQENLVKKLGTSVCTVNIENSQGTGFLLFDNFILTNAHVIEESYNIDSKKLTSAATVNFNMGSGKSLEFLLSSDVFAFLKGGDDDGRHVDFALLKVQDSEEIMKNEDIPKLPRLLKEYTSNQPAGGICIIGHPGSQVKSMDVSCIVPHKETRSAPETKSASDSILVHFSFDPDYIQSEYQIKGCNIKTHNTYVIHGSSGSPVFDEKCNLVAMHTGGFIADETRKHAIGFAIPLQSIIKNIIKQLDSRESLDAMFRFIEAAAQNRDLEEYLEEYSKELMTKHSYRSAELLARLHFESDRYGMSLMIHEELNKIKKHIEEIQQEIDVSKLYDFLASKYD